MKIKSINDRTLEALHNRRLTDEEIEAMSGEDLLGEFCRWHGLIGWADELISTLDNLRAAAKE